MPTALARWVYYGGELEEYRFALDHREASESEAFLRGLADETGSLYVPLIPYFCPDERGCRAYKNGAVRYFDGNHMSLSGARQVVADLLAPVIWPEHLTHGIPYDAHLR